MEQSWLNDSILWDHTDFLRTNNLISKFGFIILQYKINVKLRNRFSRFTSINYATIAMLNMNGMTYGLFHFIG